VDRILTFVSGTPHRMEIPGMQKLEFADHMGFDWISFSEHH
jgi:hypothetical protein